MDNTIDNRSNEGKTKQAATDNQEHHGPQWPGFYKRTEHASRYTVYIYHGNTSSFSHAFFLSRTWSWKIQYIRTTTAIAVFAIERNGGLPDIIRRVIDFEKRIPENPTIA